MSTNILHIDTDDLGLNVDHTDSGGLVVTLDSRTSWIEHLEADMERAVRLGDLLTAARDLLGDSDNSEYARGMAELIGWFAPEGDQFDSENMRTALGVKA